MKTTRIFSFSFFVCMFLGISGLFAGCSFVGAHGDGNVIKETRVVPAFDAIDISGAWDVSLKQGANQEVTVETDANIMPLVRTEVVGGVLRVEIRKPVNHTTKMKLYLTVKDLKKIEASGAVNIKTESTITVPELNIDGSGASEANMDIQVQKLILDCSGASKLRLRGNATNVKMDLSGASDIFAYDLLSENYDIEISGAGNAQISVSKKLQAEISGAGSVRYKGSPAEVNQSVSGAGSIRKAN